MNYYNEIDPFAVAWLRDLIAEGLLSKGDVDARSIVDVQPGDLRGYEQCHFFAGIGGWSYALGLAGWEGEAWTGSCPCQPFSVAGAGKGTADERHLWPAFRRLITECRPPVVFGEQVAGQAGRVWLAGVRADLEAIGYACGGADLAAASVGAPHIRQRLYWVADAQRDGRRADFALGGQEGRAADGRTGKRLSRLAIPDRDSTAQGERGSARTSSPVSGVNRPAVAGSGEPGGTGCPVCGGRFDRCEHAGTEIECVCGEFGFAEEACAYCGVGDTDDARPQGRHERGICPCERTAWTASVVIECGDGKHRRIPVEPALFPLADGLPGRVGLLKGAGNAIVAPLAAEFVAAFRDMEKAHLAAGLDGGAE